MDVVIGIGNELRGDDAIGAKVVACLSERPDLRTIVVHQLAPELAEEIRAVDRVLFVDARLAREEDGQTIGLDRVEPGPHRGLGHACSPGALLGWTRLAFGRTPEAWLLSVPGASFEPGADLSPQVSALLPEVVRLTEAWLFEQQQQAKPEGKQEEA